MNPLKRQEPLHSLGKSRADHGRHWQKTAGRSRNGWQYGWQYIRKTNRSSTGADLLNLDCGGVRS